MTTVCFYTLLRITRLVREKKRTPHLDELIAKYHERLAYYIAMVYTFRNQPDKAFEWQWLDKAYTQHDDGLIATKVDPLLKSLHKDPRYPAS